MNARNILSQLRQQVQELQREIRLMHFPDQPWLLVATIRGTGLHGEPIEVEMFHGQWPDGDFIVAGRVPNTLVGCTRFTAEGVIAAIAEVRRRGLDCEPPMELLQVRMRLRNVELRRRMDAAQQAADELERSLCATCPSLAHA